MKTLLATTLLASTVAFAAWAADTNEKPSVDDVVILFYEEPNEACVDAKSAVEDSRLHIAQDAIEHAAKFIALEARFAMDADGKQALEDSYTEMKTLAANIDKNSVPQLEAVCARALYNLAYYQHQRAEKFYSMHKTEEAGQALNATAFNMRYAAEWADHEFVPEGLELLDDANEVGEKMAESKPYSEKRAEGTLGKLKAYLRKLNIKIEPPQFDRDAD